MDLTRPYTPPPDRLVHSDNIDNRQHTPHHTVSHRYWNTNTTSLTVRQVLLRHSGDWTRTSIPGFTFVTLGDRPTVRGYLRVHTETPLWSSLSLWWTHTRIPKGTHTTLHPVSLPQRVPFKSTVGTPGVFEEEGMEGTERDLGCNF